MQSFETTIRTSGCNKKVFLKATHTNLADAVEWVCANLPSCELRQKVDGSKKYGAIVLCEGMFGIVKSNRAFYQ